MRVLMRMPTRRKEAASSFARAHVRHIAVSVRGLCYFGLKNQIKDAGRVSAHTCSRIPPRHASIMSTPKHDLLLSIFQALPPTVCEGMLLNSTGCKIAMLQVSGAAACADLAHLCSF